MEKIKLTNLRFLFLGISIGIISLDILGIIQNGVMIFLSFVGIFFILYGLTMLGYFNKFYNFLSSMYRNFFPKKHHQNDDIKPKKPLSSKIESEESNIMNAKIKKVPKVTTKKTVKKAAPKKTTAKKATTKKAVKKVTSKKTVAKVGMVMAKAKKATAKKIVKKKVLTTKKLTKKIVAKKSSTVKKSTKPRGRPRKSVAK
jgi:hypothetical protein